MLLSEYIVVADVGGREPSVNHSGMQNAPLEADGVQSFDEALRSRHTRILDRITQADLVAVGFALQVCEFKLNRLADVEMLVDFVPPAPRLLGLTRVHRETLLDQQSHPTQLEQTIQVVDFSVDALVQVEFLRVARNSVHFVPLDTALTLITLFARKS